MKKILSSISLITIISLITNSTAKAEILGMRKVLDDIYVEMMPLFSTFIGVARGIAGFGALIYIAYRVWKHIANAEPIEFFPLFRPFVLGMVLTLYPQFIGLLNGVMNPIVEGTNSLLKDSNKAIAELLKKKEDAIKKTDSWKMYVGATGEGDRDKWLKYTNNSDEGFMAGLGNDIKFQMAKYSYNFRNSIKQTISEVLNVLYEAAGLCINTVRIFFLIVLTILGPLVIGLSVYDGFTGNLASWIARYINIFLWLPVANVFSLILGKIQENMLKVDISQINKLGDTFFSATDAGYLIFMVIGICGYFTIPTVANMIIQATGTSQFVQKIQNSSMTFGAMGGAATGAALSGGGWAAGRMGSGVNNLYNLPGYISEGYNSKDNEQNGNSYQYNKLAGKDS